MKNIDKPMGLVIAGGESKRMGTDKGSLTYHEKPQRYHLYDMLTGSIDSLCRTALISCNSDQTTSIAKEYEVIEDLPEYQNIGPMAGLLSAFSKFPNNDFLVVGCDYPFITSEHLKIFIKSIKRESLAAAFYNIDDKYEPLLAWYSKEAGPALYQYFKDKRYSLQGFLKDCRAEKYKPESEIVMKSVDTPEEFEKVQALLKKQNIS